MKKKPLTRSQIRKKLDEVFSQYVRMLYADHTGVVACYTCGAPYHWKKIHAGHFASRVRMSTRWDEMNVKPQCVRCNIFKGGESYLFAKVLDAEYGEGTADEVYRRSEELRKFSTPELEELLAEYTKKRDELARTLE